MGRDLAQRWVRSAYAGFERDGQMWEKYDARSPDGRAGSGGEYKVQSFACELPVGKVEAGLWRSAVDEEEQGHLLHGSSKEEDEISRAIHLFLQ